MARTKNKGQKIKHQQRKRLQDSYIRKDRKKEGKVDVDPASLLPSVIVRSKVCSPAQKEQILEFLLNHPDQLRPIRSSSSSNTTSTTTTKTKPVSKPKAKILQFIRSHQDKLQPIPTAASENDDAETTITPPPPQLVVLGLLIPKDIHRLPSLKTIKQIGRKFKEAKIPVLFIQDVAILKRVLANSPEKMFGVEVSGIDIEEDNESLRWLQAMLAIVEDTDQTQAKERNNNPQPKEAIPTSDDGAAATTSEDAPIAAAAATSEGNEDPIRLDDTQDLDSPDADDKMS